MYREQFVGASERAVSGDGGDDENRTDKVLIVIPCLNECDHIAPLLKQISDETRALDRLIVVADGGSTDGTPSIVAGIATQEPSIRLIENPRRLQSAGVNLAVRGFGNGRRWLVRLDAHATYPRDFVQQLIGEAERTGAASVVVAMRSQASTGFQSAVALIQNSAMGAGGAAHRRSGKAGFVDHGHHALFDLGRFCAVGGYDETISHNEDAEFDIRFAQAGGRIWLTRAVEIGYFPRATVGGLFRQYVNYGRGRAATIIRHGTMPKLRQLLPAAVIPALAALVCAPWLPIAAAPALVWMAACVLGGALLALRTSPRRAIAAGIAAMTIHLGWSIGFWLTMCTRSARRQRGEMPMDLLSAGDAAS
jgi:succinoglycan biosynthesis protein ExoA